MLPWVIAGVALAAALASWMRTGRVARKLDALNKSYWELRANDFHASPLTGDASRSGRSRTAGGARVSAPGAVGVRPAIVDKKENRIMNVFCLLSSVF